MQVVPGDGAAGQGSQSYVVRRARLDRAFISLFSLIALALTGAIPRNVTAHAAVQEPSAQIAAAPAIVDTDGDGMPDDWETFFGLNPNNPGDASADPDNDGLTNLQEYQQHGHPFGIDKHYFAEGALGFFKTDIGLVNSSTTATAKVQLTYYTESGARFYQQLQLPPMSRQTVSVNSFLNSSSGGVGTLVESDQPLGADRFMEWGATGYGSSLSAGVTAPSTTWYFAEGATSIFSLYYLLLNPGNTNANVTVKYLQELGGPITRTYSVPAHARSTISVNSDLALLFTSTGAAITSDVPIVAERAMYLSSLFEIFTAGSAGAGAPQPATSWTFAEGSPGGFFDEFLLIANPGNTATTATVVYRRPDGVSATATYSVQGQSRRTVYVNQEILTNPALAPIANSSITTVITAPAPIVAERTMWWPRNGFGWYENATSIGATQARLLWTVAEGSVGGNRHEQTYVLVANTAAAAGSVQITVLTDNGSTSTQTLPIGANGRLTVDIGSLFGLSNTHFSAFVDSVGPSPVPIVVEYSRYGQGTGDPRPWSAGGTTLASPRTPAPPSDIAPTVTATTPTNNATNVPFDSDLSVTFSEPVTVTAAAFTLECPAGTPVTLANISGTTGTTFNLHPTTHMPFNTACKFVIHASAVTDLDTTDPPDNMASDVTVNFTTGGCPTITVSPGTVADAIVNTAIAPVQFTQTGGSGSITWNLQSGSLPAGLTLRASGQLAGTPTATGTFTFTVRATDANGCFGEVTITIHVTCPTITVNPASLSDGVVGDPYGPVTFTQTGSTGTATFSVTAGALPSGITLSGAGVLQGTHTAIGMSTFTVTATDQFGCSGSRAGITLTFNCPTITVTPSTLSDAIVGTAYTPVTFSQAGGHGTITFSISSGSLPSGMTLASNGSLSGTPTATGTFTFTVRATDANGCFGEVSVSLVVKCPTITVTNPSTSTGLGGVPFSQTFTQSGAINPVFTVNSGTLPSGLNLAANGVLSGTPTVSGSFPITVKVSGDFGCSGVGATYPLTIQPNAVDDTYTETILGNVPINSATVNFSVVTNDVFSGTPTITAFNATSLHGGTVSMTTSGVNIGKFTYNPPRGYSGADSFTYTISDGTSTDTATVNLTIAGMAWFIDASAGCGASCDGRLTTPYASLTAFTAVNNGSGQNPKAGDAIFVYQNNAAYTGNVSLLTNQGLYGQDHTAASFSALTGLAVPTSSVSLLPGGLAADGVFTKISSGGGNVIGLTAGNKIRGLTVNTSGAATGISGNTSGTLTISEVSVAGSGPAVNLTNYNESVSFISLTGSSISLTNTTGSFAVTGVGTTAGSGGTISGGNPNILLSTASNVSLANMIVQGSATDGIRGTNVNGLTLTRVQVQNSGSAQFDHGVDLTNPTGTITVTNSTFTGSADNNFVIQTSSGSTTLNVTGSTFSNNSASVVGENDGLLVKADTNANVTVSVTGSTFTANKGDHFQVALANAANAAITFTGNTVSGGNTGAITADIVINAATSVPGYSGTITYDISNNSIIGAKLSAITVNLGTSSAAATMSGTITNNVIGDVAATLSGSEQAFGIAIDAHGNGTHSVRIENNTIRHVYDRGISVLASDGNGALNMKIFRNTVSSIEGQFGRQGLFIQAGATSTNVFGLADSHAVCAEIGGGANANTLTHQLSNGEVDDFRIRQRVNTTYRLPGYAGGPTDTSAVVSFVSGNNNGAAGSADSAAGSYTGGAACTTP